MFNFQRGDLCPVQWQPLGGNLATLNIKSHTVDHEVLRFDVTSTGSGGHTARLAGKDDARGTVNADFDADLPFYLTPPNVLPGVSGILLSFLSPTRAVQLPMVIAKVHWEQAVDSEIKYSFDVEMNSRVGFLVYPVF